MTIGESMRPKPRSFRDGQAGFTLIELVVVVGLIGVVLAILVMGVRRASDAFSLRKAATTVISEVRRGPGPGGGGGGGCIGGVVLPAPRPGNTHHHKNPKKKRCAVERSLRAYRVVPNLSSP